MSQKELIDESLISEGKFIEAMFKCIKSNNIPLKEWFKITNNNINMISIIGSFFPKKSKILHTNYLKDICSIDEPRILTIVIHLYIENFIEEIIKKKIKRSSKILKYSFKQKLEILYSMDIIPENFYEDINFINNTRNNYAHKLNFTINNFDFKKSNKLRNYYNLNPYKRKDLKSKFYLFIYKLFLIEIGVCFSKKYPEITLIDV